ncbi:MAG: DUF5670 family protein [Acidobacteriota bacterium]
MAARISDGDFGHSAAAAQVIIMQAVVITALLAFWLVGEVTANTFGGSLHLLFLAALAIFVVNLVRERKAA